MWTPARRISIGSRLPCRPAILSTDGNRWTALPRHRSPGADSTRRLPDRTGDGKNGTRYRQAALTIASAILDERMCLPTRSTRACCSTPSIIVQWLGYTAPGQKSAQRREFDVGDYHARELALLLLREARGENTSPSSGAFSLNNVAENLWSILPLDERPVRSPGFSRSGPPEGGTPNKRRPRTGDGPNACEKTKGLPMNRNAGLRHGCLGAIPPAPCRSRRSAPPRFMVPMHGRIGVGAFP